MLFPQNISHQNIVLCNVLRNSKIRKFINWKTGIRKFGKCEKHSSKNWNIRKIGSCSNEWTLRATVIRAHCEGSVAGPGPGRVRLYTKELEDRVSDHTWRTRLSSTPSPPTKNSSKRRCCWLHSVSGSWGEVEEPW